MKSIAFAVCIILLLTANSFADSFVDQLTIVKNGITLSPEETHEFYRSALEKYPAEIYTGTVATQPLYHHHPKAHTYKTMIAMQLHDGINFAGHYNVAFWGCGTGCMGMAMTDVITGEVEFYSGPGLDYRDLDPSYGNYGVPYGLLYFRPESRVMISALEECKDWYGCEFAPSRYFVWDGQRFKKMTPKL